MSFLHTVIYSRLVTVISKVSEKGLMGKEFSQILSGNIRFQAAQVLASCGRLNKLQNIRSALRTLLPLLEGGHESEP